MLSTWGTWYVSLYLEWSSTVLSKSLQTQGSQMAPLPAWPSYVLGQVALGGQGCLVGVGYIAQPVDHGVWIVSPGGVYTWQVLIQPNPFSFG